MQDTEADGASAALSCAMSLRDELRRFESFVPGAASVPPDVP